MTGISEINCFVPNLDPAAPSHDSRECVIARAENALSLTRKGTLMLAPDVLQQIDAALALPHSPVTPDIGDEARREGTIANAQSALDMMRMGNPQTALGIGEDIAKALALPNSPITTDMINEAEREGTIAKGENALALLRMGF